jgi:hypothetical protein
LTEYAFKRLADPSLNLITEDSLRNSLNQQDIKDISDAILLQMFAIGGQQESMQLTFDDFAKIFTQMKFRVEADGRIM